MKHLNKNLLREFIDEEWELAEAINQKSGMILSAEMNQRKTILRRLKERFL